MTVKILQKYTKHVSIQKIKDLAVYLAETFPVLPASCKLLELITRSIRLRNADASCRFK